MGPTTRVREKFSTLIARTGDSGPDLSSSAFVSSGLREWPIINSTFPSFFSASASRAFMASICLMSAPQLRSSGWGVPVKITQIRDLPRGCGRGEAAAWTWFHVAPASSNPPMAPVPKKSRRVHCSHMVRPFLKHDRGVPSRGIGRTPRPPRRQPDSHCRRAEAELSRRERQQWDGCRAAAAAGASRKETLSGVSKVADTRRVPSAVAGRPVFSGPTDTLPAAFPQQKILPCLKYSPREWAAKLRETWIGGLSGTPNPRLFPRRELAAVWPASDLRLRGAPPASPSCYKANRAVIKVFKAVAVKSNLIIELVPAEKECSIDRAPIINFVEVVRENAGNR